MGGTSAGQRLCFQLAPRGAISHQRELKLREGVACLARGPTHVELSRISTN